VSYAGTAQSEYESYSDQGYIILCLMLEGDAEVTLWTETYGMTFPVLSDQGQQGGTAIGLGGGIPHHMLIGRDMTARVVMNQPSSSQIEEALAEEWPEVDYPMPPTTPEVDDELPDESADAAGGNPFGVSSVEALAEGSMCAVGDARGGGQPWAVALLLGVLALRRRR
jgi:MYXO-CTERM domain-containing protein